MPLLTDLDELERLGAAGVLSFQSLYARAADGARRSNDPIKAGGRRAKAQRRVGAVPHARCGETRPEMLVARSRPEASAYKC